jgi:dienelactone hydrolase
MSPLAPRMLAAFLALTMALSLSGCLNAQPREQAQAPSPWTPPIVPDLTELGQLKVQSFLYDYGLMIGQDGGGVGVMLVAVRGSVHYPETGEGPRPLLLFMHGRHGTCKVVGAEILGPGLCPTTPVSQPVDSFTGYDYLATNLASHGYVVISVDANHINEKDAAFRDAGAMARAQLVVRTLDEFARINASGAGTAGVDPVGLALKGRIDMSRIGLMGHSRGGEGVTKAIEYNRQRTDGPPHQIKAVFALAPTDFAGHVATDVAFATLLPYCDGDVSSLHGAWIYDDSRYAKPADTGPKHQFTVLGANHNFYNTAWLNDDASFSYRNDRYCAPASGSGVGEGRLAREDQMITGVLTINSFLRHYVGQEAQFEDFLKGRSPTPDYACPEDRLDCAGLILTSYHAPAAQRLVVEDVQDTQTTKSNDLAGSTALNGFFNATTCTRFEMCPAERTYANARQLVLGWNATGATYKETFAPQDVSRFTMLSWRAGVDYSDRTIGNQTRLDATVVLHDASGKSAGARVSDYSQALFVPVMGPSAKLTLNMVHIPLAAMSGLDLTRVTGVELRFDQSAKGEIQLADVLFQA